MGSLNPLITTEIFQDAMTVISRTNCKIASIFVGIKSDLGKRETRLEILEKTLHPEETLIERPNYPREVDDSGIIPVHNSQECHCELNDKDDDVALLTDAQEAQIIPLRRMDSNRIWIATYILLAVGLVLCAVLFTIHISIEREKARQNF